MNGPTEIQKQIERLVTNGIGYYDTSAYHRTYKNAVKGFREEGLSDSREMEPIFLKLNLISLEQRSPTYQERRKRIDFEISKQMFKTFNLASKMDLNESGYAAFFTDSDEDDADKIIEIVCSIRSAYEFGLGDEVAKLWKEASDLGLEKEVEESFNKDELIKFRKMQ